MDFIREFLPAWLPAWAVPVIVGLVWAFWQKIQNALAYLSTHLISVRKVDADLSAELLTYMSSRYGASKFGQQGFIVISRFVRSKRKQQWILSRWIDKEGQMTFWVRLGWVKVPIWLDRGKDGTQMTIRFFRGTFDFEAALYSIVNQVNTKKANRYKIIRAGGQHGGGGRGGNDGPRASTESPFTDKPATAFFLSEKADDIGEPNHQGGPDDLWLHPDVRHILDDARQWFANRNWYLEHRLPWRRGYLAYGNPGTGKTSLARAIGIDLDFPIYAVDLPSMTNQDLTQAFDTARQNAPCMILFEDLDAVYNSRLAIQPNTQLGTPPSFDHLLNQIQGVGSNDGLLVIITTNHLDKVDHALGGPARVGEDNKVTIGEIRPRPGRIDRILHTPDTIDYEGRLQLARRMLPEDESVTLATATEGMTPAQCQEVILTRAQELL